MIENIGAAMATFFVLAAVKPTYRFVAAHLRPRRSAPDLWCPVWCWASRRSNQSSRKDAVGLQHSTIICINETRQQSVNVKPREYTRSRASGMSMRNFVQQRGQFEMHADAMVIYG